MFWPTKRELFVAVSGRRDPVGHIVAKPVPSAPTIVVFSTTAVMSLAATPAASATPVPSVGSMLSEVCPNRRGWSSS